jgi:hypothetical protein
MFQSYTCMLCRAVAWVPGPPTVCCTFIENTGDEARTPPGGERLPIPNLPDDDCSGLTQSYPPNEGRHLSQCARLALFFGVVL